MTDTKYQCLYRGRLFGFNVTKNDVILGLDWQDKNDITRGQANSSGIPPNQKVSRADEITYKYQKSLNR